MPKNWVNPNKQTYRQRMDRRLEAAGLLNYQTAGLSQEEIARRYAAAGISINGGSQWYEQNYGVKAPEVLTNRQQFNQYRQQLFSGNTPNIFPRLDIQGQPNQQGGFTFRAGGGTRGIDPKSKTITTTRTPGQEITTAVPKPTNATSPYAPMVFAKPEQVQKGEAGWQDLSSTDRQNILRDPNFYKSGQITQYSPAVQQQILADPNFDWKQLPEINILGMKINPQRLYYSASSNPAAMGAVQGLIMGQGNPGGAAVGGLLGWAAGVVGYDPSKEFWQQGDQNNKFDKGDFARGAFGLLNWGAEQVEKGLGIMLQSAAILTGNDPNFDPNKRNLSWDAGANTFEVLGPAVSETSWVESFKNMRDKIETGQDLTVRDFARFFPGIAFGDMLINPDQYKGEEQYLGSAIPTPMKENFYQRLNEAEQRINAGEPYREVMMDFQNGMKAQVADMVGQAIADPLNVVGTVEAAGGSVISRVTGDKVAQAAFDQSLQGGRPGVMDAQARLRNIVNTPGEAIKIDPNYKVQELGAVSRFMSGLSKTGEVTAGGWTKQGLFNYKKPENKITAFVDFVTGLKNPESRARVGQDLLISNVGRIMASYFNGTDVLGFANWWRAFSKGDMTQAADLSRAMANSPEFYTVLPAAQNFDMDAAVTKWTATDDARQAVTRIADALGENPVTMIEDMAKRGTAEQDFTRLQERLAQTDTPEARALLAEINDGRLTSQILQDTVKLFSNGDVPYHPGQWMAQTLKDIQNHYDTWAVDHFKLDAEAKKTYFRMSSVLKSVQSVLLLGANPGYMISNVLPTMVTRAMSGVWGYMTPKAIDSFLTRMGFDPDAGLTPNRLDEGVGPGGLTDQARGQGDAIREAVRGNGIMSKIENAVGTLGRNMPFNKLSRLLEGYEGKQAYLIGMKKFWGEGWRRGKGFRELPTGLVNELQRVAGPRAADILYSHIEAGLNKQEIQNIVSSATRNIQSRTLINEAATRLNIPASKAAGMMEQAGVFDALDASLKNAKTEAQITRAFERAAQTTKMQLDQQAARDAIANIEHVANKLNTEGMKAVTDIILDTEDAGIEQWLRHYQRMGEVADAVESLDNPQTRSNLWSLKYAESSAEFRRHNAHKGSVYLGVLKALGQDANPNGRALLANLASTDAALDAAYRTMRQLRDEHFSKWNNDWDNPRRQVERTAVERQVEQAWNNATKTEIENSRRFGELLGSQYEALFGVEAGEAARQAWEQITEFRKEMTQRRDAFRKSIEGMSAAQRQVESQKFWGETYKYMIVEMQRIKTEAIRKLDAIANRRRPGGDMTGSLAPNDPNAPTRPPAEDVLRGVWNSMEVGTNVEDRLNVFARRGGDNTAAPAQTDPTPPTQPPAAPAVDEMARLRQQAEERKARVQTKLEQVWDVAEQFGYDARDQYKFLSSLNKYGDFQVDHYTDERLTPEYVREVLTRRESVKAEQQAMKERNAAERAISQIEQDAVSKPRSELPESISNALMMEAQRIADVIGGGEPGKRLFNKSGFIGTAKSTYPNWYNDLQASVGGKKKLLTALEKIVIDAGADKGVVVGRVKEFLMGNIKYGDSETNNPPNLSVLKDLGADEPTLLAALDEFNVMMRTNFTLDQVLGGDYSSAFDTYFDSALLDADAFDVGGWQVGILEAMEAQDFTRLADLVEQLPAEYANQPYNVTGETYNEFISRSWDEMAARVQEQEQAALIADNTARAERAVQDVQTEAETGFTRAQFRESLTEVFGLDENMADAVMDITDARANAYGDVAEWYRTRIADVQRAGDIDLAQESTFGSGMLPGMNEPMGAGDQGQLFGIQPGAAGKKTKMDAGNARSVTDIDPTRTAKDSTGVDLARGDIVLDAQGNRYNVAGVNMQGRVITSDGKVLAGGDVTRVASQPDMFGGQAQQPRSPKAGVRFMEDGRAIIRAWEGKADVSSIVHEIGHIFRRDLQGADLRIIEQWAEVKDGNWTRAAEEKFARGFERYLADGSAPTPKLRRVFEQFKTWMVQVYRAITGSPIDIDLTPQVKEVFDRLLTGQEQPRAVDLNDQLFQMGYDPKAYYVDAQGSIKRRGELNIRVDKQGVARETEAVLSSDFARKLQETKRAPRTGESVDPNVTPRRGNTHELSYDEFKANIFAEQKARAEQMLDHLAKVEAGELPQDAVPELMRDGLKKVRDDGGVTRYKNVPTSIEEVRAKYVEMRDRNTISYEMYGDVRERWMQAVEQALRDAAPVKDEIKQAYYGMKKTSAERMQGAGVAELFQEGDNIALGDKAMNIYSDNFKKWFGDSKVIDADGSPLVVYHGTNADDFQIFDRMYLGAETLGNASDIFYGATSLLGYWFNTEHMTKTKKRKTSPYSKEIPAYLSIENPFEVGTLSDLAGFIKEKVKESTGKKLPYNDYTIEDMADMGIDLKKQVEWIVDDLQNEGYDGIVVEDEEFGGTSYIALKREQIKSVSNRGTWDPNNPNIFFQEADPRMPLGAYDESAGWFPQSQAMDEVWAQEFVPLLDGMREVAIEKLNQPTLDGAYKDMSPEGQRMLINYLKGVQQDMASTKMAAQRWGQDRRDFAMLNYNSRTGFDQWLDIAFPYQFFYTRSMMTWAARVIDNPAILANYARIRRQQDRYENNLPERLRGKIRIEAPYLPDWMGDALYIDPLSVLFTPHNFLRPFEQMAKDNNMQVIEAERILQEWAADGTIPEQQIIDAAQTRSGSTWERALAEAKMRREAQIANPMDFVSATFGPAWYLTTPAKLLGIGKDGAETLTELPITRTARAVDTVTQNTWAEPIGNLIGLLAKPEETFREAQGLPEFGEYGDYYVDRQLANMVAEGLITSEDAQIAMIERQGELFDQARERVKMELAMRVPLIGATYAGLNSDNFFSGLGNFIQALPPSLFGAGLLPEGELAFMGDKQAWQDMWKLVDAGDTEAKQRFFDEHPEYEAYLAKNKEPEDRLRAFLRAQIWDGYYALGETDRKTATAELGDEFKQSFLDSETRSYDTIDIETLTQWAQMVNKKVPTTPQTLPAIQNPRTVDYFSPEITKITDQYYEQRTRLYPNYYELQSQYYTLPKSERRAYLIANPSLKEYWDWNRSWKTRYPELEPVFNGQVFKRVNTETWNPLLVQYVADYAYSGTPLGPGAYKALEQIWINEGQPRGDFETWLKNDVAPSFLYGQ